MRGCTPRRARGALRIFSVSMSTRLNASIVDQQVRKVAEDHVGRLGNDETHARASAFVALCVRGLLDLDLEDALDCITDGGDDAGIDALHLGDVRDGEFVVTLFQGKYRRKLDEAYERREALIKNAEERKAKAEEAAK